MPPRAGGATSVLSTSKVACGPSVITPTANVTASAVFTAPPPPPPPGRYPRYVDGAGHPGTLAELNNNSGAVFFLTGVVPPPHAASHTPAG
eukprot:jgi/Chrpa1/2736/Chrysochromulina_OHIO_Genome00012977-RA